MCFAVCFGVGSVLEFSESFVGLDSVSSDWVEGATQIGTLKYIIEKIPEKNR